MDRLDQQDASRFIPGLPATKMVPVQARRSTVWPRFLLPQSGISEQSGPVALGNPSIESSEQ